MSVSLNVSRIVVLFPLVFAAGPARADTNTRLIIAQGSDRLPGGVELFPAPGTAPAPTTATAPLKPVIAPPIIYGAPAAPVATPPPLDAKPPPASPSKKSKKSSAPLLNGRSAPPRNGSKPDAGATGGDDRRPGGVEHVPD